MSATHARRSRLARFADLFRYDPARPPRPVINVAPGVEIPAHLVPDDGLQRPPWDGEPGQGVRVHMRPDEDGIMPCCGLTEFDVPRADCVTIRPELVTCPGMPITGRWAGPEAQQPFTGEPETGPMTEPPAEVLVSEFPGLPLEYPPAPADTGILSRVLEGLRALGDGTAPAFAHYPPAACGARIPAAAALGWLRQVRYPSCYGTPEEYAAVMRRCSAVTGTSSLWERPAAWPRPEIEAPGRAA